MSTATVMGRSASRYTANRVRGKGTTRLGASLISLMEEPDGGA